jgi:hypothetical protein
MSPRRQPQHLDAEDQSQRAFSTGPQGWYDLIVANRRLAHIKRMFNLAVGAA